MRRWLCCVLLTFLAACQAPRETSVKPGINDSYENPDVDEWVDRFESESREIYRHRHAIADKIDPQPGAFVADVGAGTGFVTVMFADAVGAEGRVYAVDITEPFLKRIDELADERGLANVHTVLCKEDSVELPPSSVDLVFICDTYHHFEYPKSTLASIHTALRAGGEMVIIDFDRVEGKSRQWVLDHVRAGKERVIGEVASAGFEFLEDVSVPFLEENYMLRFRKAH